MNFESLLTCEEESALELLIRLGADGFFLNTKLESLNQVISLSSGKVYEIDGDMSSGKTQICYSICAKFLSVKRTGKVLWISAVPLRTDRLIRHLGMQTEDLDRIICNCPKNIDQLLKQLNWARRFQESLDIQLVFVEDIDALLHDTAYEGYDLGRSHQFGTINKLHKIADLGATVVITNHITRWRGYPAPALGNFWASQISYRFFVEKTEVSNIHVISTMRDGESQAIEKSFRISDEGLEET